MGENVTSVSGLVGRWVVKTPHEPALRDGGGTLTYGQLGVRSDRIASALASHKVPSGACVGYLGKNSTSFFEIWIGANKARCALAPLNWRSSSAELAQLIADAGLSVLFVGSGFSDLVNEALQSAPRRPEVVDVDAISRWCGEVTGSVQRTCDPADVALLAYTSGTTGRPKGVPITNRALLEWFHAAAQEPSTAWDSTDVGLMTMPNFHLAGTWVSLPALFFGACLVIAPAFEPTDFLAAIREHGVTTTCLVPTAIQQLLQQVSPKSPELQSLRRILYAGSPISADTLRSVIDAFDCELVQFYGTTETFIITLLRPEQHQVDDPQALTSCGQPMNSVQLRIVDDSGIDVVEGTPGQVLVRSPWMFEGYRNQPAATDAALKDGWYHTGDVALRDATGNLHLVDRLKDMIVTGGENVYSAEVERALGSHPAVSAAAVIGERDEKWGERVVAFVVPGASGIDVDDLLAHCRSRIAGYKVPKQVYLTDALPMTPSGKVQKERLRSLSAGMPQAHCADPARSTTQGEK
jgi:acyl-CoA synthetase (AMP-forming)/AMP-acid ligase II